MFKLLQFNKTLWGPVSSSGRVLLRCDPHTESPPARLPNHPPQTRPDIVLLLGFFDAVSPISQSHETMERHIVAAWFLLADLLLLWSSLTKDLTLSVSKMYLAGLKNLKCWGSTCWPAGDPAPVSSPNITFILNSCVLVY